MRSTILAVSVLVGVSASVAAARIDATGSWAGQLRLRPGTRTADVALAITQSGRQLAGTLALGGGGPALDGAYQVQGTASGKTVRLVGVGATGGRLVLRGRMAAGGLGGTIRVRGPKTRARGAVRLGRRPTTSDGASCDAVFAANQTFFETDVLGRVLAPVCAACHVAGGQAQATRLRVLRGDALATARSVAPLIDLGNPAASLIVTKPLAIVPHGGGQRLTPGSAEAQILRQWADLVAQAGCAAAGPQASTPAALFATTCGGCHGADGAGLAGRTDVRCSVKSLLVDAVRNGRGSGMPAFARATLSDAQLDTIVGYLQGTCSGAPKDVYASNCASCHGPTAGGGQSALGVRGPNIRCSGGGEFGSAVRYGTEGMPAFPTLGGSVGGLAAYLQSLCSLGGGGGEGGGGD